MYKTEKTSKDFNRFIKADLVIAGGGVAGVNAAVAAAREGLKTVLVQNRPVLGGPSSSECGDGNGNFVNGASEYVNRNARECGIMEELKNENVYLYNNGWRNHWSLLLRDFVEREPNAKLILNAEIFEVKTEKNRITEVIARGIGSELFYHLKAPFFIDASGDGVLGFNSDAEFRMGREGKDEFGERLAPEKADAKTMGNSIAFRAVDVGHPVPFKAPSWAYKINSDDDLPYRLHTNPKSGYWWLEHGGEMDTIADTEEIYDTLKKVLFGMWDHVKNGGDHGAENYAISWVAPVCGKRESRRIIGDVILTEHDVLNHTDFEDSVAYGGWPIDIHPPEGVFSKGHPGSTPPFFFPGTYTIPFRSLYSKNIENLLTAGRDISVSHVALGSMRVMATCGLCGQAAGTAASLLKKYNCTPRELAAKHVVELRSLLQKNDLTIPEKPFVIEGDITKSAKISASSSMPLVMQKITGASPLVAKPKDPAIYDPCDTPPEDRRIGQSFIMSGDVINSVRMKFNNKSGKNVEVTARLRREFFGDDIAVSSCMIAPGNEIEGLFEFGRKVSPGRYAVILDAMPDVDACTSSRYLPGIERKLDGGYNNLDNLVFEVEPAQFPYIAENVTNDFGRPSENCANMWISDPASGLPQTLALSWTKPVKFSKVDLIFDTNLDKCSHTVIPPECIKDYRIEAWNGNDRTLTHQAEGNYRRFRRHTFQPLEATRLVLTISETNGDESARLISVRIWE